MAIPGTTKRRLDIRGEFDKMLARYDKQRRSFNAFVYGFPKKGKTHLLRTARKPVLLFQFDPNGAAPLTDLIESGDVIVQDFSHEPDPSNPKQFRAWEQEVMRLQRIGLFDHVGTVAVDSVTTWVNALALAIFHKNGRPFKAGGVELFHGRGNNSALYEDRDYGVQLTTLMQYTALLVGLPCDTIFLAHARDFTDRKTNKRSFQPLLAGQLKTQMPLLFDEVYVLETKRSKEGLDRVLWTQPKGYYEAAGSRYEHLLEPEMPADIKAILEAMDLDTDDIEVPDSDSE